MKNVSVNSLPVQNFLGWSKAGTSFFSVSQRGRPEFVYVCQRGTRIFLRMPRGDQKKLATGHHKQMAPLPEKNDSSLKRNNGPVRKIKKKNWNTQDGKPIWQGGLNPIFVLPHAFLSISDGRTGLIWNTDVIIPPTYGCNDCN